MNVVCMYDVVVLSPRACCMGMSRYGVLTMGCCLQSSSACGWPTTTVSRTPRRVRSGRGAPRARETVVARGGEVRQVGASGSGVVSRGRHSGSVDVWSRQCEKRRGPRFCWMGEVSSQLGVTLRSVSKVRKEAGDVGMMPCGSWSRGGIS